MGERKRRIFCFKEIISKRLIIIQGFATSPPLLRSPYSISLPSLIRPAAAHTRQAKEMKQAKHLQAPLFPQKPEFITPKVRQSNVRPDI